MGTEGWFQHNDELATIARKMKYMFPIGGFVCALLWFSPPTIAAKVWFSPPRRAFLNETYLAYLHIAKTGGTSFNQHLSGPPFSPRKVRLNCGHMRSCCESASIADTSWVASHKCPHISYEWTSRMWEYWQAILQKKANAVLLTHLRSPLWHSLSMLGHDFAAGRISSYDKKLSGQTNAGYNLDNPVHSRFRDKHRTFSNTSVMMDVFEHQFFWFGITEHTDESLCLLLWQLQVFDNNFCKGLCHGGRLSLHRNNAHANKASNKTGAQLLSQAQLKGLAKRTEADQRLYEFALSLFHHRVNFVETDVGFRFLNCDLSLSL